MMGADETHTGRDPTPCPFCRRVSSDESLRPSPDGLAVAIPDAYPLAPGHTLVVPRRHEPDLLGLTSAESLAGLPELIGICGPPR